MSTIVVGYDHTPGSQLALERAATLAKALGAKLVVTSVAPVMFSAGRSGGPIDPTDTPQDHAKELATAREYLEAQGIEADYQAAIGEPADAIVQLANERHADMIVIGTREPNLIQRLTGQSVSESVTHHAHCDVLIVHHPHDGH
jgi:nucleotide-binding universal stress UspA family protein